jgi:preprotein translocase SecE subunit
MNPITLSVDFLKSSFYELQKVTFPTKKQLIQRTVVVTFIIIISLILIGLYDAGIAQLLKLVLFK